MKFFKITALHYLILISNLIILSTCKGTSSNTNVSRHYEVELTDSVSTALVKEYGKALHINKKSHLIYLTLKTDTEGKSMYISNSSNKLQYAFRKPMAYAKVDSFLVLIYGTSETFIKSFDTASEINEVAKELGIHLNSEYRTENSPLWRMRVCSGKQAFLFKDGYISDGIPCGCNTVLDSLGNPKLICK